MKPNFYKQYDSRWSSYSIKGASIGRNGCGPSSIANIVSALVNSKITPKDIFKYMMNNGYIDPVKGSYWNGITNTLKAYGITKFSVTSDSGKAYQALKKGHWLIGVVAGPCRWTRGGHYIVLYGLSGTNVLVSDSASNSDYRQKQGTWNEYRNYERMQWIDIDPDEYTGTGKKKESTIYTLYVQDARANIRKGRGEEYGVHAVIKRGTKLKLYSYKNGWYRIKNGKYKGYYISEKTLSKYEPHAAIYKTLMTMNIRAGYTTSSSVIKTIKKGVKVKSSKLKGNWVYIPAEKGWICIKDEKKIYLKEQ